MSVLKNKRALSELEFFHNATELRREITLLLLRDFGVKDKVRTVKSLYGISNMEPEDTKKIQEMVEKYGMCGSIVEEYPMWLIDKKQCTQHLPQHDNEYHPGKHDISDE